MNDLSAFPEFSEFLGLDHDERMAIMPSGFDNRKEVHIWMLRWFAFATSTMSSDVHVSAHRRGDRDVVCVSIRMLTGFLNFELPELAAGEVRDKFFQMTNTPQGGSTPICLSTRFPLSFPIPWARDHKLPVEKAHDRYNIDVRVEFTSTADGFSFVCRLLDQQRAKKFEELGLTEALAAMIRSIVAEPSGLFLVSGPTGSGKTTLLNAILGLLNTGEHSIFTLENPVEYTLYGPGPIKQVQVGGDMTFERGLKSALRSDPDIILVGEIRDKETMAIALQAAQTGHLVLSTIHANSCSETISRAIDLLPSWERDAPRLADTLKAVVAQRLIDVFEPAVERRAPTREEIGWARENGIVVPSTVPDVKGNKAGKAAIIEAINIDFDIRELIKQEIFDIDAVYRAASQQLQYETLPMAGMRLVETGQISIAHCRQRLESNRAAGKHMPMRSKLVMDHGIDYRGASAVIDQLVESDYEDQTAEMEKIIKNMKGLGHA